MSQEELANKCNVTRQTINAIENNKYDPTLSLAFNLSKNLSTTVDNLFIFEEGAKCNYVKQMKWNKTII